MSRRKKNSPAGTLDDLENVDLLPWDPRTFVPDSVCMIVGPRGHGKTVFFEDLLSYIAPKLYMAIGMSPTHDSRLMFERHMPFTLVYHDYDPDKIGDVMSTMRDNCQWLSSEARQKGLDPETERERRIAALFLDDCLGDKHALAAKSVSDVFMQGRHEDVCFITMMQYLVDMPKRLRGMLTYIMLTSTDDDETIEMLHRMFFKRIFSLPRFGTFFKAVTKDHKVLVIDRSTCKRDRSGEIKGLGNIFNYKARYPAPEYSVCCATVWYCHYAKMISRAKLEEQKIQKLEEMAEASFFGGAAMEDPSSKKKNCTKKKTGCGFGVQPERRGTQKKKKTTTEEESGLLVGTKRQKQQPDYVVDDDEYQPLVGREHEIVKRAAQYSSQTGHTFNVRDFTRIFGEKQQEHVLSRRPRQRAI